MGGKFEVNRTNEDVLKLRSLKKQTNDRDENCNANLHDQIRSSSSRTHQKIRITNLKKRELISVFYPNSLPLIDGESAILKKKISKHFSLIQKFFRTKFSVVVFGTVCVDCMCGQAHTKVILLW